MLHIWKYSVYIKSNVQIPFWKIDILPEPEFEEDTQEDEKEELEPASSEGSNIVEVESVNADTVSTTTERSGIDTTETNEKPTYANLFKNTGGPSKMVAAGPLSLPPAGFGKTSQPTSTSTSPPVTKEGSPAAGFQVLNFDRCSLIRILGPYINHVDRFIGILDLPSYPPLWTL